MQSIKVEAVEELTALSCKPLNIEGLLFYKNLSGDPDDEGCSWKSVYRLNGVDPEYEVC